MGSLFCPFLVKRGLCFLPVCYSWWGEAIGFTRSFRLGEVTSSSLFLVSVSGVLRAGTPGRCGCVPGFIISCLGEVMRRRRLGIFLHSSGSGIKISFLKTYLRFLSTGLRIGNLRGVPGSNLCAFISGRPLKKRSNISLKCVLKHRFSKGIGCLIGSLLVGLRNLTPLYVPVGGANGRTGSFPGVMRTKFGSSSRLVVFPTKLYSQQRGKIVHSLS